MRGSLSSAATKVHLAGAGVGEADLDAGIGQGLHQGLCAVHHDKQ
jgi:hypothetical protein